MPMCQTSGGSTWTAEARAFGKASPPMQAAREGLATPQTSQQLNADEDGAAETTVTCGR